MQVVLATSRNRPALTPGDALLAAELEARGARVTALPWDVIVPAQHDHCRVCLRSTWDYHLRSDEFRRWVAAWDPYPSSLWNPPPTVLWNVDKIYLRDLAAAGIRIPSTRWIEPGHLPDPGLFLQENGFSSVVVKPRVSATAYGTRRVHLGEALPEAEAGHLLAVGSLLQEFVPEIGTRGELSLMFIGGRFSHAVCKRPAAGDFRVQSDFGGSAEPHTASDLEREFGAAVLAAVPHIWVYARVDIVMTADGPLLMELELIEPELFLKTFPGAASRLAEEILRMSGLVHASA